MTRPLGYGSHEQDTAQLRNRVTRLERRPSTAPAAASGDSYGWATPLNLALLEHASLESGNQWASTTPTVVNDSTYLHGGYHRLNDADGQYIRRLVNIGPKGSYWKFLFTGKTGPDYGIMEISIATALESISYTGDSIGNEGELQDGSVSNTNLTWVTLPDTYDMYTGTEALWTYSNVAGFKIMGDPGDVGTAMSSGDYDPSTRHWDGGPGPVWVEFKINGKNGSSSGYKWRLSSAAMIRVDDNRVG